MQQCSVEQWIDHETDLYPELCTLIYDYYVPLKISAQTQELNRIILAFIGSNRDLYARLNERKDPKWIIVHFIHYFFSPSVLSQSMFYRRRIRTFQKFGNPASIQLIIRQQLYRKLIFYQYRHDQRNRLKNRCAE